MRFFLCMLLVLGMPTIASAKYVRSYIRKNGHMVNGYFAKTRMIGRPKKRSL